jgi:hypothetical protein
MQRAQSKDATPIHFQSQATRILPGHGKGALEPAVNDDEYLAEATPLQVALEVAGNVIGGALLFALAVSLPHLIAGLLR